MARLPRVGSLAGIAAATAGILIVVLSAVHLLPQLRNLFAETTTVRSEPVILKSITELSRPDRQLLLRQPEQPAAGLHPGPAEDPGRRPAEPAADRGAEEPEGMLDGMLTSLGFQHITVTFGPA